MIFLTLFNNKGGVGKTSLVYHLAWMFSEQGYRVLAADLDPQANLTAMFLDEEELETLSEQASIYSAIAPLLRGVGDIQDPETKLVTDKLMLIPGDLRLSLAEDSLSETWPKALDGDERSFRVLSALYRIMYRCGEQHKADIIFIDVGPNLGALNRTALIASDYIITPLAPDIYSLQGLRNLGPTVRMWRKQWQDRLKMAPEDLLLPSGSMNPLGYIVMQHAERQGRPTKSYRKWIEKMPQTFHAEVLADKIHPTISTSKDPYCLARLKHYRSLMPMAMEARKPMFHLTPADGAFGSHAKSVADCREDFERLVATIEQHLDLTKPS